MNQNRKTLALRIARIAIVAFACLLVAHLFLRFTPYPELAAFQARPYGFAVHDRNGRLLRVFPAQDGVRREWVPLDEIPAGVLRVFLHAEDRRFFLHPGVDLAAVAAAGVRNLRAGRTVSGASTITMQLARMITPREHGMRGKVREGFDALRLEARLSKDEILELWINNIPFGSNIEGLPAASRARFGREPAHLDDARAALLAVIPRRPALFDPAREPGMAVTAALTLSHRAGLGLDQATLADAAAEASPQILVEAKHPFFAPHFTDRVARLQLRSNDETHATRARVRTTLDLDLQLFAERRLVSELSLLEANRVNNGAILVIDNHSGAVLVYVGSASWFDDAASGQIDGVTVRNQPGSTLKPFLFAQALENGFSPNDILPDIPTVFGSGEAYSPTNFNRRFHGPVRFRVALASSLNIPSVYVLERLGVGAFEEYLVRLGFDSIATSTMDHGLGLALGNAEVTLEELTRAFAVFPRGGRTLDLRFTEAPPAGPAPAVISEYASWLITDILADSPSRFLGFGQAQTMMTAFPSIFKTGTANQFQHIWALGASPRYTVGVWMGNFSGETVIGRTGSSIPARIASDLLYALEAQRTENLGATATRFPQAPNTGNLREARICSLSGMAATPACPGVVQEWLVAGTPLGSCTWHLPNRGLHTGGGQLGNAPEFPPEFQAWLAERFRRGTVAPGDSRIRLPTSGSVFHFNPSLPPEFQAIRVETTGFDPGALVYANGVLQGSINHAGVFALPLRQGTHLIVVED
ncbi:MAG: penicillin-binding protein 1C, partial [Treponema sp.]|nr:penicillin-binding protein 1C [Treponema sp.]